MFGNKNKQKKRYDELCEQAEIFIQVHFVRERDKDRYKFNILTLKSDKDRELCEKWYNDHDNPDTFSQIVEFYLKESGKNPAALADKLSLGKDYFTKLFQNRSYNPSKGEAIMLAFAFRLNFEETRKLLRSADLALTNSSQSDLIVRFFIEEKNYSLNELNYVLKHICKINISDI